MSGPYGAGPPKKTPAQRRDAKGERHENMPIYKKGGVEIKTFSGTRAAIHLNTHLARLGRGVGVGWGGVADGRWPVKLRGRPSPKKSRKLRLARDPAVGHRLKSPENSGGQEEHPGSGCCSWTAVHVQYVAAQEEHRRAG